MRRAHDLAALEPPAAERHAEVRAAVLVAAHATVEAEEEQPLSAGDDAVVRVYDTASDAISELRQRVREG